MTNKDTPELKQINYEIFVIILTALSWLNFFLLFLVADSDSRYVIIRTEQVLTLFFLLDFLYRLKKAESRRQYFRKYGWLDLIGSFPFLRWARAYRVYMTTRYIQKYHGRYILKEFISARAETAALTVILAVIFLFEFASIFILRAEEGASGANIVTAGDAVWGVLVSVATVGYGDLYPVTGSGRFIAVFVITAGVGLFGILSGFLARNFLGGRTSNEAENTKIPTESNLRIDQILAELKEIRLNQTEIHQEQEAANEKLKERLSAVEKLLEFAKMDE